jgi:dienelactone hydrolase
MAAELAGFRPGVTLGPAESVDGYTRQRGILQAEPDWSVPFWFLRPQSGGPHPVALFPHGHYAANGLDFACGLAASEEDRRRIAEEDRDVAVQAVRRGFAALAPATRGFLPACVPDIAKRHGASNCRSHAMHALLAGRTAVAERLWDLQRLLDWAVTAPGLDPSRVLMMGNSGGGTTTLYAAACDERISVAVASCSFCPLASRDGHIHHCDCNAVPGILRFGEFWDVAGLIAPRRLLVVHGRQDPLFPAREIERAVAELRRIFDAAAAAAAPSLCHAWGEGGHRFYAALMWPFVMESMGLRMV